MVKRVLLLAILAGTGSFYLAGQTPKLEYFVQRAKQVPKIDGLVNDEAWKDVIPITQMTQREPVENVPATMRQEIRVIYDNTAIYVSAVFYDPFPDSIVRELGSRDDQQIVADKFYIGFDTYNTYDAYVFGVTASGVQYDYRDSDLTYDAVWTSSVKITRDGWSLEMMIPYSALRFPSKPSQEWGFQLIRTITRTQEYDQWALTSRTVANSRLQWGKLRGLNNINPPVRLSWTPFIMTSVEKSPYTDAGGSTLYSNNTAYNFGADMKLGLNEKFTLDLTLLPDFSQVKSDNLVKSLGYQEITYDENRPFFKEGTDLFSKNQLFYSRRIGKCPSGYYMVQDQLKEGERIIENPANTRLLNAVKISGRNNSGLGIGLFNAVTDNMYAIVEDNEGRERKILTEPLTNYNILVFDQQMKNNSSVYLINTNVIRDKKADDANVTGAGFSLQNKKNSYAIDGDVALSQHFTVNDSLKDTYLDKIGHMFFLRGRKISGNFQYGISHTFISKTYDSRDLGYYIIGNRMREGVYLTYNTYVPRKYFRESYTSLIADYGVNPVSSRVIQSDVSLSTYFVLHNYHAFGFGGIVTPLVSYDYYEPRVQGRFSRTFRYYMFTFDFNSDTRKALAGNVHFEFGDFAERFNGKAYGANGDIRYRVTDRFQIRAGFNYYDDTYNIGFVDVDESGNIIYGGRELITYITNIGFQYLFKNDMSLTLNSRHYWNTGKYSTYYNLLENGDIEESAAYNQVKDFSYNSFYIDLLYSWQFAPGSNLSLSYKNFLDNEKTLNNTRYLKNFHDIFNTPQTNGLSLKVVYYLDYQRVRGISRVKRSQQS
ncbi:MAG: DUF5916 domain-containing protein [Bacteroidetes bacterium]|nr:DUF5916 domain-containing protein [Bacteroidota bacterium]